MVTAVTEIWVSAGLRLNVHKLVSVIYHFRGVVGRGQRWTASTCSFWQGGRVHPVGYYCPPNECNMYITHVVIWYLVLTHLIKPIAAHVHDFHEKIYYMDDMYTHRILLTVNFWRYFYGNNMAHPLPFSVHPLLFLGLHLWSPFCNEEKCCSLL